MSYGKCMHNCTNQTSSGYCKTTTCINPLFNQISNQNLKSVFSSKDKFELIYAVPIVKLRRAIHEACEELFTDKELMELMYTKICSYVEDEISENCSMLS